MKAKIKLFYEVSEQQYYVYYEKGSVLILYKVENINPLMLIRISSSGTNNININTDRELLQEIEEITIQKFKEIEGGY